MNFRTEALTSPGGREINEDALASCAANDIGCWILADGLGGHGGGEIASRTAVEAVVKAFQERPECSSTSLASALDKAHQAVSARRDAEIALGEMRTTIVALTARGSSAVWGHVGDSRLYFFRNGVLARQTKDHSVPQRLVDSGELAARDVRFHEDRNRLLQTLGGPGDLRATILEQSEVILPGDVFLLASDGFWEYVTETAMEIDLAKSRMPAEWLRYMERRLWISAPAGNDNYSAIAVFVEP